MQVILDYIKSPEFLKIVSTLTPIFIFLVSLICSLIRSKTKNEKLRRLTEILPEAMIAAENSGGEPVEKLFCCLNYIKERVKLSDATIVDAIENAITISKNVNVYSSAISERKSSESIITTVRGKKNVKK